MRTYLVPKQQSFMASSGANDVPLFPKLSADTPTDLYITRRKKGEAAEVEIQETETKRPPPAFE